MNEVRLFPDHCTLQMPAPTTKADWIAKMKSVGINVPIEWNLIQIKAAWADYQETKKDSPAEIMKEELSGLNSQEGRPSAVPGGHGGSSAIQGDCGSHVQQGRGSHHPEVRTDRQRNSGLWQVWDNDIRRGGRKPPGHTRTI